jgi:hypothetical protein
MPRTVTLRVILYGSKFGLSPERRKIDGDPEDWMLRRIFGPKQEKITLERKKYVIRSFITCDQSPPSIPNVKNVWCYTSAPPILLRGVVLR